MKTLILSLVLLFSNTSFANESISNESISSDQGVMQAQLLSFDIKHEHLNDPKPEYGNIEVNIIDAMITLTLSYNAECPTDNFCTMNLPALKVVNLPIINRYIDECNNAIYIARIDRTPVDGEKETLRVVDNTNNMCPTLVALPATAIIYTTYNPWISESKISSFTAEQLN